MKGDLLREATCSLRQVTDSSESSASFTRMRVMNSLHGARRRCATRVVLWIPLAAVLAGATAAAATGYVPTLWVSLGRAVGFSPDPSPQNPKVSKAPTRSGRPSHPVSTAPKAPALPSAEDADTVEPIEPAGVVEPAAMVGGRQAFEGGPAKRVRVMAIDEPNGAGATQRGSVLRSEAGDFRADPSPEDAEAASELALYREAHRAHFDRHDCQAAVLGWERYLAEAPQGRFTLEARYNRALCLVRIGRHREAAAALTPFAEGFYGDYRRADARALLDALKAEDSGGL